MEISQASRRILANHPAAKDFKFATIAMLGVMGATSALCAQNPQGSDTRQGASQIILCDESAGCDHEYIDGVKYKILNSDGITVIAAIQKGKQGFRAQITVSNNSAGKFDVVPTSFKVEVAEPKAKVLAYAPPEKFIKSAEHRAAWANAINAFGAGMASQSSSTTTTESGNVNVYGSNGTSANATYNGQSVSTTRTPDYAAQAQARENIRRRREAIRAMAEHMVETSLKSNTVSAGGTVTGYVYFESDKAATNIILDLPVAGKEFRFPFNWAK